MCVIAVKPAGYDLPDKDTMLDMFEYNADGAGFAYALNKRVYIEKGFMNFEDFERGLEFLEEKLKTKYKKNMKDLSMMFHFRIGTHGPNSPELTHPFPISHKKEYVEALDLYTDVAIAHNGIIDSVSPNTGWSDTTQYIKDVLFPLYRYDRDFYKNQAIQELIKNTINGSRFVFLDRNGEFTLIGDWKDSMNENLEGIKFSNLNHEDYAYYGRWQSPYRYYYEHAISEKPIKVKKLNPGTFLIREEDLDDEYNPKEGVELRVIDENEKISFYVNNTGDVYYGGAYSDIIRKSDFYTFAVFSPVDIFYFLTTDTLELDSPVITKYYEEKTVK